VLRAPSGSTVTSSSISSTANCSKATASCSVPTASGAPRQRRRIRAALLAPPGRAAGVAASLTSLALASDGQDNASAVVLRVNRPAAGKPARLARGRTRPPAAAAAPEAGAGVRRAARRGSAARFAGNAALSRAPTEVSGQQLVLKTLRPELADDADEIARADHGGMARAAHRLALLCRNWCRPSGGAVSTTCRAGTRAQRCSAMLDARPPFYRRRSRAARHPAAEGARRTAPA
jgi:hypothetical protein